MKLDKNIVAVRQIQGAACLAGAFSCLFVFFTYGPKAPYAEHDWLLLPVSFFLFLLGCARFVQGSLAQREKVDRQ